MIKAEVVFDENEIHVNGYILSESQNGSVWYVQDEDMNTIVEYSELEKAIKYCMEN